MIQLLHIEVLSYVHKIFLLKEFFMKFSFLEHLLVFLQRYHKMLGPTIKRGVEIFKIIDNIVLNSVFSEMGNSTILYRF
jgi:hypothetical protein